MEDEGFMEDVTWERFQAKLDEAHEWPSEYVFKFIVPANQLDELTPIFGNYQMEVKESSKGKYVSVTVEHVVQGSDEVVKVYRAASQVKGVIAL